MTTPVGQLSTYFTNLVSNLMVVERQPLQRITAQRDELSVKSGAYNDLTGYLRELQGLAKGLISTSPEYNLQTGRSPVVSGVPTGSTVLTASATTRALAGTYQVSVTRLATQHQVRSDQQATSDQALGLAGTIRLGGAETSAVTGTQTAGTPVSAFAATALAEGQTELGSSHYSVETRLEGQTWQFRLVDGEGKAVSIRRADGTGYSTGWQTLPTTVGAFDTGRGLSITFDGVPTQAQNWKSGAAAVDYQAKGAEIDVTATDSLNTLAAAINAAQYADGDGISATIVDRQLVLASRRTGESYKLDAVDKTGTVLASLGVLTGASFKHETLPVNAVFMLNNIEVIRSANTGLDDVVTGVTLNLAGDAEGKTATLTVSEDVSASRQALDAFVTKFNSVQTYLSVKTEITSVTTGDTTTYKRGTLSGDTIFSDLRTDLFSRFMSPVTTTGRYDSLREIGLVIDDNLQASVSDGALLEAALKNNPTDVALLLDEVMGQMVTNLNRFTQAETGYLVQAAGTFSTEIKQANFEISDWNTRLVERELNLRNEFSAVEALLSSLSYMQEQWKTIFNLYG